MTTRKFTWGVKHGILIPDFWKEVFSGTQVTRFSTKSLKLLPPAARF